MNSFVSEFLAGAAVTALLFLGYHVSRVGDQLAGIREELARLRKMVP